jgi:hypothetical protein
MANKSPFEDSLDPFQDPSITSALNSSRQDEQEGFTSGQENIRLSEDFNPTSFHHVSDNRDPFSNSTTDLNNSGSSTKIQTPANTELDAREQALLQKERELADRERDLERRNANQGPHGKNFPPCFPLFYLDINAEIPVQHQQTMWWLYREWLLFEVTLVINFIACLCLLFSHPDSVTSAPADLGISLTEMFTHTAASFFLWYRPVYNAYIKETSLYYGNGFIVIISFLLITFSF